MQPCAPQHHVLIHESWGFLPGICPLAFGGNVDTSNETYVYDVLARFGPNFWETNPARRGIAMADVQSEVAFGRAAASFDVHESDYLVLVSERVSTMEAMAFRFPQASDFEDFMKKVVRTKSAYRDREGMVVTYPRSQVKAWDD